MATNNTTVTNGTYTGVFLSNVSSNIHSTDVTVSTRTSANRITSIGISVDFSKESNADGSSYTFTIAQMKAVHDAIVSTVREYLGGNF